MTRDDIAAVIAKVPGLNNCGVGFEAGEDRGEVAGLLASADACTAICGWLGDRPRTKRIVRKHTSYSLKHAAERALKRYVTNGQFIAAAVHCGFRHEVVAGTPNVSFAMGEPAVVVEKARQAAREPRGDARDGWPECPAISGVYALVDPRSGRTMYVGQAIDVERRYHQHCKPHDWRESNRAKAAWATELAALKLSPRLVVLTECGVDAMDEAERAAIRHYKVLGQCEFNIAPGGRGERRAASSTANSHPDDWRDIAVRLRRIQEALLDVSSDLIDIADKKTRGRVSDAVMAVHRAAGAIEDRVTKTYPEWGHVARAFDGMPDGVKTGPTDETIPTPITPEPRP